MSKRDVLLGLLDPAKTPLYIPAGFFLHFDPAYHRGQAAVDRHLEYFRHTGMDFVKIQYEHTYPRLPELQTPADWARVPSYGKDFFVEPLRVVEGLVKAAKKEALVLVTLYSPFMCAGHSAGGHQTLTQHLIDSPGKVKPGLEAITESVLTFARECARLGVDGFYASTQGGEAGRFPDAALFDEYVKPYDLAVMTEINRLCAFNILHICDYSYGYDDLTRFLDYPGQVVNCSLKLGAGQLTPRQVVQMFGRPFMGGLDRHGVIAAGSTAQIRDEVSAVLRQAPERFILAADCTVPSETPWANLRTAIETAHAWKAMA